jgi:hypothetical protein
MSNVVSLVKASENPNHWTAQDLMDHFQKFLDDGYTPDKLIVIGITDQSESCDIRYMNKGCNSYELLGTLELIKSVVLTDLLS